MSLIFDRAVFLEANGLNKTLKQAIIDGDLSGGGGSAITEIFATEIVIGSNGPTITGLVHFKAIGAKTISSVSVQLYEKGAIVSGILEVDIKINTTPNDVGMASIFTVKPSFDFSTAVDYDSSSGTLASSSVASGSFLRLDITSIPSGFRGTIYVSCYA